MTDRGNPIARLAERSRYGVPLLFATGVLLAAWGATEYPLDLPDVYEYGLMGAGGMLVLLSLRGRVLP